MTFLVEEFGIELKNVALSFKDQVLFRNVSVKIAPGEIFTIIGPSGSGKSTLLKTMSGLIAPTEGEVLIGERDLLTLSGSEQKKIMRQIGMLFQKNALFDSLTVGDNVAFPLRETTDLSEAEIQSRVVRALGEVGIGHAKDLFPDEISGGMQKRLGIARALALEPRCVFYDDPTAGLDPITSRNIINLIVATQKKFSATVVAVTNDMNRAFQMSDRIAMLVDQELLVLGNGAQARASGDPRVRQFILGQLSGPLTELV